MIGAVLIVIVVVIAIPVGVLVSGAVASALIGWFLEDDVRDKHADSELLDLNG
jgi:hypothetical protein